MLHSDNLENGMLKFWEKVEDEETGEVWEQEEPACHCSECNRAIYKDDNCYLQCQSDHSGLYKYKKALDEGKTKEEAAAISRKRAKREEREAAKAAKAEAKAEAKAAKAEAKAQRTAAKNDAAE